MSTEPSFYGKLTPERVTEIAKVLSNVRSNEFKLGAMSVLYAALGEDDEGNTEVQNAKQELVTTIVYLQSLDLSDKIRSVSGGTRQIAAALGITDAQLAEGRAFVEEVAQREAEQGAQDKGE